MIHLQNDGAMAHHHVVQAHQSGLIIGTIVGSTATMCLVALVIAVSSPSSILHPLSLRSNLSAKAQSLSDNSDATGSAMQAAQNIVDSGLATRGVQNLEH
jgi:hypothetical protein